MSVPDPAQAGTTSRIDACVDDNDLGEEDHEGYVNDHSRRLDRLDARSSELLVWRP